MDEILVDADRELLARLRAGDEAAFMTLVDRYGALMLRVALMHVRSRAVAEEVVQEAWLGVIRGLDRFEGRSSLKTWILRIVANLARTRAVREQRSVPLSSLEPVGDEPSVDPIASSRRTIRCTPAGGRCRRTRGPVSRKRAWSPTRR